MNYSDVEFIDGIEYRLVTLRNRSKLVSKYGDIINPYKRNQKATLKLNRDGYPCCGGGIPIHLYVANGWVDGWFKGAEVNHIDYNRENYIWSNLEWVTHKQNISHSSKYTNHYSENKMGTKNGMSKFKNSDVIEIRNMYNQGMSVFDIIRKRTGLTDYNDLKKVSSSYYCIVKNKTWKHI